MLLSCLCALLAVADSTPRAPGPAFLLARYATHSSLALYGGYGSGRWFAFAGLVNNPRSGYRESIVGAGRHTPVPGGAVTVGLAAADASDSRYTQLYLIPTVSVARISLDATVELYAPLESRGVMQASINPALLLARLAPRLSAGVSYLFSGQHGAAASHGIGPALRVPFPNGTITLALMRRIRNVTPDARVTVQTAF